MGTAAGNLMGYWDRHGFPDFYSGPVNGGLAPLDNFTTNSGIVSLWASQAGLDGRPTDQPGHVDDYWTAYESTSPDPYVTAGRSPHAADCIGDFIGLSQMSWTNMAGECNGNLDGFCFNYWDANGDRRTNFVPDATAGLPARDVQSGLRAWTQFRGYDCTVISQLTDFSFADLKAEIDAGYPVLLSLQDFTTLSRTVNSTPRVNPLIHSMLAYGYAINLSGGRSVYYMTSWAEGGKLSAWTSSAWQVNLPVRGVILYHPLPRIRQCQFSTTTGNLFLQWDAPASYIVGGAPYTTNRVHYYAVQMASSLAPPNFAAASGPLATNVFTVTNCPSPAFFRVQLVRQ